MEESNNEVKNIQPQKSTIVETSCENLEMRVTCRKNDHSEYKFHELRTLINNSLSLTNDILDDTSRVDSLLLLKETLEKTLDIIKFNELLGETKIERSLNVDSQMKKLYIELHLLMKKIRRKHKYLKVNLIVNSSCSILEEKMIILCNLIMSYIRISIANDGYEINIKCHEVKINGNLELVCDISDNINITCDKLIMVSGDIMDHYISDMIKNKNKWIELGCSFSDDEQSIFRIIIRKDNTITSETSLSANQLHSLSLITKKIILIVDDSIMNIKIMYQKICNFLIKVKTRSSLIINGEWDLIKVVNIELENYHFVFCCNGQLGYDIATIKECYFIISDLEMPVMDGIEMINKLLEDGITTRIFISSSHNTDSVRKIKDISPEILEILPKACSNDLFISLLSPYFSEYQGV